MSNLLIRKYDGEYLGGHVLFADKRYITLSVYQKEVVVDSLGLHIPYSSIKEVKNVTEENIKALRVVMLGVIGALWKKKEKYLCIVYDDGVQDQNPVFKLDNLDDAQRVIYRKVAQEKLGTTNQRICASCGEVLLTGARVCWVCGGRPKER